MKVNATDIIRDYHQEDPITWPNEFKKKGLKMLDTFTYNLSVIMTYNIKHDFAYAISTEPSKANKTLQFNW